MDAEERWSWLKDKGYDFGLSREDAQVQNTRRKKIMGHPANQGLLRKCLLSR